jgi:hypothetical protein
VTSIIKKRRGGSTYLYAATSARVEGRPRIVEQVYLGTEEEVIARLTTTPGGDPGLPETEHRRFGDVTAVWAMLARLDAIAVIDSVVGDAPGRGVSVGTYLGLAALNRVCEPKSKRAFAHWWSGTAWVGSPGSGWTCWITAGFGTRWTRSPWTSWRRSRRR